MARNYVRFLDRSVPSRRVCRSFGSRFRSLPAIRCYVPGIGTGYISIGTPEDPWSALYRSLFRQPATLAASIMRHCLRIRSSDHSDGVLNPSVHLCHDLAVRSLSA
jgi:hypothetical protein